MGQSHLQFEACRLLIASFLEYLPYYSKGRRRYRVGGDLIMHLDPNDMEQKITPAAYVIEDELQADPCVPAWMPWEHGGKVPRLVIEIVSEDDQKDYDPEDALRRYQRLGVQEVVRYDPEYALHKKGKYARQLFGHFMRTPDGRLVELEAMGEVILLQSYPVWLIHKAPYYLRLATGTTKETLELWPDPSERADAEAQRADREAERAASEAERAEAALERAKAEAERAKAEAERAKAEAERADAAERELALLQKELARLRADGVGSAENPT